MRMEKDSMGEIAVPENCLWGAQTQRSLENFQIGDETMPQEIIVAFAQLKKACALANLGFGKLNAGQAEAIADACDAIAAGQYNDQFPLHVWQTGSGTQSNMNVNEVIAHLAAQKNVTLHPNDHVNLSQSSNDTFPTALHMAAAKAVSERLIPATDALAAAFGILEEQNRDVLKIGRTHLQDAVPLTFAQEISGWRAMLEESSKMIRLAALPLLQLAIGGTAVGTGLNAPEGFDAAVCEQLQEQTGLAFSPDPNKFHALTSKDAVVYAHGAIKALACNLMKIANDIRHLASGPRCGIGEISIPANEPGSSIMPGKVNPTQCEAVTMVAVQVMGNDTAIGVAASQGNYQLNVFLPVIAYDFLQSVRLLADAMDSFRKNCVVGIQPNREKMEQNLRNSLMLATCLTPKIGYEAAAEIAKAAHAGGISLRQAAIESGRLTAQEYDAIVEPQLAP